MSLKFWKNINWDKIGLSLSFICAIHCMITPILVLLLPIVAHYYMSQEWFHWVLALLIVPVGIFAFVSGFKHHRKTIVFYLGIPGLIIVGIIPLFFHEYFVWWSEALLMVIGSTLLISSHWINRKSCACHIHGQQESTKVHN